MEFEWDEAKHIKTLRERGIGFNDAARIFEGNPVVWVDDRIDYGEVRFRATGPVGGNMLTVVYTRRGNAVRIISARRASKREIGKWSGAL